MLPPPLHGITTRRERVRTQKAPEERNTVKRRTQAGMFGQDEWDEQRYTLFPEERDNAAGKMECQNDAGRIWLSFTVLAGLLLPIKKKKKKKKLDLAGFWDGFVGSSWLLMEADIGDFFNTVSLIHLRASFAIWASHRFLTGF